MVHSARKFEDVVRDALGKLACVRWSVMERARSAQWPGWLAEICWGLPSKLPSAMPETDYSTVV